MMVVGLCLCVQESVEMRAMESSASSTIPFPGSDLENQGRAASMPRLNAELQVTPPLHLNCLLHLEPFALVLVSFMTKMHIIFHHILVIIHYVSFSQKTKDFLVYTFLF